MRSDARAHERGFSLMEVTVALLLFSILAGTVQLSMTRRAVEDAERNLLERTAGDFYRIAQAAQHYAVREGAWPGEDNRNCRSAYTTLYNEGLLKGVSSSSDFRSSNNVRQPYRFSCNASHFSVTVYAESRPQAARLHRMISGSTHSNRRITAHYPKPVESGPYMALDGSKVPTGTWNMGNQYMFGVRDVVSATGQTLANSVQFATTAAPGQSIAKPDCPSGMQPRIFTALSQVAAPSGRGIHGIQLPVTDGDDAWTVNVVVHTSLGKETIPTGNARVAAFVKCSY